MTRALLAALALAAVAGCQPAASGPAPCPDWSGTYDFSGSERVPQPPFETTGNPYHLRLAFGADDFCLEKPRAQADFFILDMPGGERRYSRYGEFRRDERDLFLHVSGGVMYVPIQVPKDTTEVVIDFDGLVKVRRPGSGPLEEIGVVQVPRFPKASALRSLGAGLFEATAEAGTPLIGRPALMGHGRIFQGQLDRAEATRTTPPAL